MIITEEGIKLRKSPGEFFRNGREVLAQPFQLPYPVFPTRVYPTCNQRRMVLIFLTIMFLLVGFMLTSVGVWAKETLLPVPLINCRGL